jgi:hypothetical protein
MSISTYFRPSIHQNGPEILGVMRLNAKAYKIETFTHWCPKITYAKYFIFTKNLLADLVWPQMQNVISKQVLSSQALSPCASQFVLNLFKVVFLKLGLPHFRE